MFQKLLGYLKFMVEKVGEFFSYLVGEIESVAHDLLSNGVDWAVEVYNAYIDLGSVILGGIITGASSLFDFTVDFAVVGSYLNNFNYFFPLAELITDLSALVSVIGLVFGIKVILKLIPGVG